MTQLYKFSLFLTATIFFPLSVTADTATYGPKYATEEAAKDAKEQKNTGEKKSKEPKEKYFSATKNDGKETITSALQSAYINNTELAAAVAQVNQRNEGIVQAKAGYRPKITGTMSLGANQSNYSGDEVNNRISTMQKKVSSPNARGAIEVSQNIYQGGATNAAVKVAENSVLAQRARLMVVEQTIFSQVIQAFLEIITAKAEIKQYEANLKALSEMLTGTTARFNAGEDTRTSVAQAKAQLAEGEGQLEDAKARLEAQQATFQRLTGKRVADDLVAPEIAKELPATLEKAIQIAMENNPEIIQAKYEEASSRYNIDKVGAGLLPSLDLVASTTYTQERGKDYLIGGVIDRANDKSRILDASLRLTVPIYEQGLTRSQKREAHDAAAERRISVETVRRKITESVITFWQNYISAKSNIESFKSQVEAREVSLDGTRKELEVGQKIVLDVLNAQRDLLLAQLNLIRAQRTYFFEAFRLLGGMGRLTAKQLKLKVKYYDPSIHYNETKNRI